MRGCFINRLKRHYLTALGVLGRCSSGANLFRLGTILPQRAERFHGGANLARWIDEQGRDQNDIPYPPFHILRRGFGCVVHLLQRLAPSAFLVHHVLRRELFKTTQPFLGLGGIGSASGLNVIAVIGAIG